MRVVVLREGGSHGRGGGGLGDGGGDVEPGAGGSPRSEGSPSCGGEGGVHYSVVASSARGGEAGEESSAGREGHRIERGTGASTA